MITPNFRRAPTLSAVAVLVIGAPLAAQQVTGYDPATGYQIAPGTGGNGGGYGGTYRDYPGDATGTSFGNGSPAAGRRANGFYLRGVLEAELLKSMDEDDSILFGDLSFGFVPAGGGLGADFGLVGYDSSEADELVAYGALSFALGGGRMQVGAPRAVLDDFMDIPPLGGSRFLDIGLGMLTSSFVSSHALLEGQTPYGLRYDTSAGALDLAASAHGFGGDDAAAVDLAAAYRLGAVTLSAGAEHADGEGLDGEEADGFNLILGGKAEAGKFGGGLYYSTLERPDDIEAWTAYGTWRPLEPLEVTGSLVTARASGEEATLFGVSADYNFAQGAYLQGGFLDGDDQDATYDLSLGWKF
ncbi:MAG: hypothetical protein H5U17_03055 [Defluviimonas sp.]|nr:hypothetical protein [Defluviimonas sp.]